MNLEALQENFQDLLLAEQCQGASWVADSKGELSAQDRIRIYHNAYRVRLAEVLRDNFEHTAIYLGDDWFYRLANSYIQRYPSESHNISIYGHGFSAFLAEVLPNDQDVAELAEMDWRLRRAFDGHDGEALSLEGLQKLAASGLQVLPIAFVPTASIVSHHHNTLDIWHAIDSDQAPPNAEKFDQAVDILIWRKEHSPHFRSLTVLESAAIRSFFEGWDLNQTGERLAEEFPSEDVAVSIGRFCNGGLLTRLLWLQIQTLLHRYRHCHSLVIAQKMWRNTTADCCTAIVTRDNTA